MLKSEFEMLTDIFPDSILYDAIEEAYNNSDYESKEGFCHDYKFNVGGLAQRIQENAELERWRAEERHRRAMTDNAKIIQELSERLKNADFGTETVSREKVLKYALYGVQCDLFDYCNFLKSLEPSDIETTTADKLIELSTRVKELQKALAKKEV